MANCFLYLPLTGGGFTALNVAHVIEIQPMRFGARVRFQIGDEVDFRDTTFSADSILHDLDEAQGSGRHGDMELSNENRTDGRPTKPFGW